MKERSRSLRANATKYEHRLWIHLKEFNKRGCSFRRQAPFDSYILDFVDHAHRVVIELDGDHHGEEAQRARDEARDALLSGKGYAVLRFANFELVENMEGVVDLIWRTAQRGRA